MSLNSRGDRLLGHKLQNIGAEVEKRQYAQHKNTPKVHIAAEFVLLFSIRNPAVLCWFGSLLEKILQIRQLLQFFTQRQHQTSYYY